MDSYQSEIMKANNGIEEIGRRALRVPRQEVPCFFLEWNGDVLCYILATFMSSNTFFTQL
jgi:hypothetical protein